MSNPIKSVHIDTTDGETFTASYTSKDGKGETRTFDSFDEANEWVHDIHATSEEQPELQQELDPGIVEAQERAQENAINQAVQNEEAGAQEIEELNETEEEDGNESQASTDDQTDKVRQS